MWENAAYWPAVLYAPCKLAAACLVRAFTDSFTYLLSFLIRLSFRETLFFIVDPLQTILFPCRYSDFITVTTKYVEEGTQS